MANLFSLYVGSAVTVTSLFNIFPLLVLVFTYAIAREFPRSQTIVVGSILVELF